MVGPLMGSGGRPRASPAAGPAAPGLYPVRRRFGLRLRVLGFPLVALTGCDSMLPGRPRKMPRSFFMYALTRFVVFGPRTANVTTCRSSSLNPLMSLPPSDRVRLVRRRGLSPRVLDTLEQLVRVEDSGQCVDVPHEIVVFHAIVGFADRDRLAQREADVGQSHVVLSGQVEEIHHGDEAARIDLRDAGNTASVLLQIDAESSGDARAERPDGADAGVDDSRVDDRLGQPRDRGGAARLAAAAEVRQPLDRLHENKRAVLPQALAREISAWEVLRDREGPRRHPAYLAPVRTPVGGLPRARHGRGAARAAAASDAAPHARRPSEVAKRTRHGRTGSHGERAGHRHAIGAEVRRQTVLVLAERDRPSARQEYATGKRRAQSGYEGDVVVRIRDEQIDLLAADDTPERRRMASVPTRGHEVVPVRGRLAKDEAIVVAADDDERRVTRPETADQAVAGPGARAGDEDANRHPRSQGFMGRISRLAKLARMSGPLRPPSC